PYGGRGRRPKKGRRLPTPAAMIEDEAAYPPAVLRLTFPKQARGLRGPGIRGVVWDRGGKGRSVVGGPVRDPPGPGAGRGRGRGGTRRWWRPTRAPRRRS